MRASDTHRVTAAAFSLVEVVVVVVIIGLLASMAIPRLSRGAEGATDAALDGDLAIVRRAIQRYAGEHGKLPGPTPQDFVAQLTQYSDADGATSGSRSSRYRYGPYLVAIPPAPVGPHAGSSAVFIDAVNSPPKAEPSRPAGWVYNPVTGEFYANDPDTEQLGIKLLEVTGDLPPGGG